jgi:hypothetical protein
MKQPVNIGHVHVQFNDWSMFPPLYEHIRHLVIVFASLLLVVTTLLVLTFEKKISTSFCLLEPVTLKTLTLTLKLRCGPQGKRNATANQRTPGLGYSV